MTAAACCAESVTAQETFPLSPYQAEYRVLRGGKPIGLVHVNLTRRDDGLWNYRIESEATAWYVRLLGVSTTESSWFDWRDGRIVPLTYHHVSREPGRDRYWQHRYQWDKGISDTRTHDGDFEIDLVPGLLDPLTLRLDAILTVAAQDPEFAGFERAVLERDEIETQEYRYVEPEAIELDGRCFDTRIYRRFRREGSSRNYLAWHARALDWLPVRIAHRDDGTPIELELTDLRGADYTLPEPGDC